MPDYPKIGLQSELDNSEFQNGVAEYLAAIDKMEKQSMAAMIAMTSSSEDMDKAWSEAFSVALDQGVPSVDRLAERLMNVAQQSGMTGEQFAELATATGAFSEDQIAAATRAADLELQMRELQAALAEGTITADEAGLAFQGLTSDLPETTEAAGEQVGIVDALKGSYMEFNAQMEIAKTVLGVLQKAYDSVVPELLDYAKAVRDSARLTGMSAEETSRLIQLGDDYMISQGQMTQALNMAVKRGFVPTTEALAQLADKYVKTLDPAARAKEMTDKFGYSWKILAPILEQGGDAIRAQSAAISDSLILTDADVKKARELEIAQDNLNDVFTALRTTVALEVIPTYVDLLNTIYLIISWSDQLKNILDQNRDSQILLDQTYDEYVTHLKDAAAAAGYLTDAEGNLYLMGEHGRKRIIEANYILDEEERQRAISAQNLQDEWDKSDKVLSGLTAEVLLYAEATGESTAKEEEARQKTEALRLEQEKLQRQLSDLQLFMADPLGKEIDNYNEKQDAIKQKQREIQEEIDKALKQGYKPLSEKILSLQGEYRDLGEQYGANATEHELATKRILFDLATQYAAIDGTSADELVLLGKLAKGWGLIGEATELAYEGIGIIMTNFHNGQPLASAMKDLDLLLSKTDDIEGMHEVIFDITSRYHYEFPTIPTAPTGPPPEPPYNPLPNLAPFGGPGFAPGEPGPGLPGPRRGGELGGVYTKSIFNLFGFADAADFASAVSSLGDFAAQLYTSRVIQPMEDKMSAYDDEIEKLKAELEATPMALGALINPEYMEKSAKLTQLEEDRAKAAEELAAAQEKVLALQEQEAQMNFLEQQMKLLEMIKEYGLNPEDILGGIELGVNASLPDLIEAMTRAMQELVAQAEAELEAGSPSQKFVRIAESVMNALTDTITAYSDRPARAMQLALQSMVTAASFSPLQTIAGGAGVSNQYYANFGGVNIYDQMGIAEFQALIRSTVAEALGGL